MSISFLIPTPICLHTAIPYIEELRRRDISVHFIVDSRVRSVAGDVFRDAKSVIDIDEVSGKHRIIKALHNFLRLIFTSSEYSQYYPRWLKQRFENKNRIATSIIKLFIKLFPNWRSEEINARLHRLIGKFLANPFPTSNLIYITTSGQSQLLCARGLHVFTIMESWDHPGKAPIGHSSDKVFVWNKSLQEDWSEFQGDKNIGISYPVKLAYAIEANNLPQDRLLGTSLDKILYPATCGSTSDQCMFDEELKLIGELCEITRNTGKTLLIKPKPNDKPGALDQFRKYKHVEIGQYQKNEGGANYSLSSSYNEVRLAELSESGLVINLSTTFALDAAAYGLPVVQLQLKCPDQYPYLSAMANFTHLDRHFYGNQENIFTIEDTMRVGEQLAFLKEPSKYLKVAETFSLQLRKWIAPELSLEQSVAKIINECVATHK